MDKYSYLNNRNKDMPQTKKHTPTKQQFSAFESAYEYFNKVLFSNELPPVILNLSRKSKAMGFVAPNRWRSADTEPGTAGQLHELSINPEILCMDLIEVYSTLAHEQCHIWQYTHGKPSRPGYHNKEWAHKMIAVGLMPSTTGKPGGNIVGQSMGDYPIEGGVFLLALNLMPDKLKFPFISTEAEAKYMVLISGDAGSAAETQPAPTPPKKNKLKYTCPQCQTNVWGKADLNLICGCNLPHFVTFPKNRTVNYFVNLTEI